MPCGFCHQESPVLHYYCLKCRLHTYVCLACVNSDPDISYRRHVCTRCSLVNID